MPGPLGSAGFQLSWGSLSGTFSLSGLGSAELSPGCPSRDAQTEGRRVRIHRGAQWWEPGGKYNVCTCTHVCLTGEAEGQTASQARIVWEGPWGGGMGCAGLSLVVTLALHEHPEGGHCLL